MKKKKKIIIISVVVLLAALFAIFLFSNKSKIEYSTSELKRQDLKQTVSEVGTVKASQEIGLNFLQAGKLNLLHVAVGDEVSEGQILAELDYSSLSIKKEEVLAVLSIAKTNQDKLIKGASYEDISVLEAQVKQAEGSYNSAKNDLQNTKNIVNENIFQASKNLADLQASNYTSPMSIKQSVESAKINLSNAEKSGQQNISNSRDSLLSSFDYNFSVAKSSLDVINRILNDEDIKNVFSVKNYYYKSEVNRFYEVSKELLPKVNASILSTKLNPSSENLKKTSDDLSSFLSTTFTTLNNCFSALENTIISSSFPQPSLDAFKANINGSKTQVNSSISSSQNSYFSYTNAVLNSENSILSASDNLRKAETSLSDAISSAQNTLASVRVNGQQQISSAEARLDSANKNYEVVKLQLAKLKTPAKSNDLKLAQAQVDQADASLQLLEKQIEDNSIKTPISGKIVKINYKVGEQVSGAQAVISLLTENNFEIEALISESDISKIKIGNETEASFDAFDDENKVFGKVYFIEPASTAISDVIYYKVKINFPENELSEKGIVLKSGMTANIEITTNLKNNILVASSRAILTRTDGSRYVRVLKGKNVEEINVETGISGNQAMVEIKSDALKESDLIVTSIKNN